MISAINLDHWMSRCMTVGNGCNVNLYDPHAMFQLYQIIFWWFIEWIGIGVMMVMIIGVMIAIVSKITEHKKH